MKVRNVNGTSRFIPRGYNSWLDYWEKQTGKSATICSANSCWGTDLSWCACSKSEQHRQMLLHCSFVPPM